MYICIDLHLVLTYYSLFSPTPGDPHAQEIEKWRGNAIFNCAARICHVQDRYSELYIVYYEHRDRGQFPNQQLDVRKVS